MNQNKLIASLVVRMTGVHSQGFALPCDFIDFAARFSDLPGTVVLLSGGDMDCARYHMLGVLPWLSLAARADQVTLEVDGDQQTARDDPFEVLDTLLKHLALPEDKARLPFEAGLMGYLAYDLKDGLEDLPRTSVDDLGLPSLLLYAPSVVVVFDRQTGESRLMAPVFDDDQARTARNLSAFYAAAVAPEEKSTSIDPKAGDLRANFSQSDYKAAVSRVIDYIGAGDVYQVNLSQRFEADFEGDGFALFRRLFESNPAPFFAFVQAGDHQIVSTSPERFLLRRGTSVETRPIKGTRPREEDPVRDAAMRQELTASAKDDAELSMIVDLLRNDIGKVCKAGSVRVAAHKRVEAYRNVFHLVSDVKGELDDGKGSADLIRAAFPGGSITGCPKVRAMEIIDELEPCRRHVYCGSIGYISFHDTLDLSIAIRTATLMNNTLRYSVGGGIVYDSDPQAEYEETLHKGRTLMAACRATPSREKKVPMVWFNGRIMPADRAAVPVSDLGVQYGYGFFETILALRGEMPLLRHHLVRLDNTWRALMPGPVPDLTWQAVISQVLAANGLQEQSAAVKILVTRGSAAMPPWDHAYVVSAKPYVHRLAAIGRDGLRLGTYPHPRQTPLAVHKTLNYLYYLRAGQWAAENGCDEALILNPDGSVSETNTANLLLVSNRQVVQPFSQAVLPGVMTQAVCRQLMAWDFQVTQRPLQPAELFSAQLVLATNALMGAVPVAAVDGRSLPMQGDLWQRLNDALLPRWR